MKTPDQEQPIEAQYVELMKEVAHLIDHLFNSGVKGTERKTGWVVLCFPFGQGEKDRMNYLSNAERGDMILAMKEFIAKNEGRSYETDVTQ